MSSARATTDRQQASDWLRRGQLLEAQGSPAGVAHALTCYEQAATLLRTLPAAEVARELGVAQMNRGNVLHKLGRLGESISVYDEAIASLGTPAAADPAVRNSLGAAWMNRGYVLLRQNTPEARAESLRSQDEAIALLQTLPCEEQPAFRFNLAGAWLNRSQALLGASTADLSAAHAGAATALGLVQPVEREESLAAGIALMARHALCTVAAARLQSGANQEWLVAASDSVDAAMELVRHWEQRQPGAFRPHAIALYRFGAQFYLSHQPQFLAEFLLETLDPARTAGAIPGDPELHAIARQALARARADHYNRRLAAPIGEQGDRLQETAESLAAAEARLATLQPDDVPQKNPVSEPAA